MYGGVVPDVGHAEYETSLREKRGTRQMKKRRRGREAARVGSVWGPRALR